METSPYEGAVAGLMSTNVEREALLARLTAAFARKDNVGILEAMRADVDIEVPGSSPLAGHHRGVDAVGLFLSGLQRVFVPATKPIEYSHDGNEMFVSQTLRAAAVEWVHRYRITFDQSGRIERLVFEPDDIEMFDALVASAFASTPSPAARP
jgi:ketosteroid isomerase-like protein